MNNWHDNDESFEQELRQFRPAAPREPLMDRLEQAVSDAQRPEPVAARKPVSVAWWREWSWRLSLPMGATALLMLTLIWNYRGDQFAVQPDVSPAPVASAPVEQASLLVKPQESRVVELPDGRLMRGLSCQLVSHVAWQEPDSHARMEWTVPRDGMLLVPLEVY